MGRGPHTMSRSAGLQAKPETASDRTRDEGEVVSSCHEGVSPSPSACPHLLVAESRERALAQTFLHAEPEPWTWSARHLTTPSKGRAQVVFRFCRRCGGR